MGVRAETFWLVGSILCLTVLACQAAGSGEAPLLEMLPGHGWSWRYDTADPQLAGQDRSNYRGTATYEGQVRNVSGRPFRVFGDLSCAQGAVNPIPFSRRFDLAGAPSTVGEGRLEPTDNLLSPNETSAFKVSIFQTSPPAWCAVEFFDISEGKLLVGPREPFRFPSSFSRTATVERLRKFPTPVLN